VWVRIGYSRSIEKVVAHSSRVARDRERRAISEWQVYADNKPVYELLSEQT
jgi:hypothetical protein